MRKHGKLAIVVCVMLALLLLSACGKQEPAQQDSQQASSQPLRVTFAGSSPGGVWYMVMGGVTETINKSYPGSAVTVIPGDGVSNITRVAAGQAQIGMTHSAIAAAAVAGNDPFKQKVENIAAVASLYPSQLQFVITKKSGITSIEDIKTKKAKIRISVDSPGSTGELAFKRMINEYGLTYDDIKAWGGEVIFKGMADSSDMLNDGLLDGMSTMTLYPASPVTEAAVNNEMVILPIKKEVTEALAKKYGYGTDVIPNGTYKFQTADVTTISSYTVIIVPKNSPDDTAYAVAKSIKDNLDYLKSVHVAMKPLTPELLTMNLGIPLHPGAEKFYKEAGVLK